MTLSDSTVPVPRTSPPAHRTPSASRYWVAVLLAVAGVVAAVVWAMAGEAAASAHAEAFVRAAVPGQVAVRADEPRTFYVYAEGTLSLHPTVQVTGPDGRAVAVSAVPAESNPLAGSARTPLARFDAQAPGSYTVTMSTGSAAQGEFSVGDRFPLWMRLADAVAYGLVLLGVGAGLVLATVTAVQRRRFRGRRSPTGP
jgi:methionine-rich copper-binding protein CopC